MSQQGVNAEEPGTAHGDSRQGIVLTSEQDDLWSAFSRFFAAESPPDRVRAAEPLGFDAKLWDQVGELGVPSMGVETGLLECALVAEAAGRHVAPVPVVETIVASRVLGEVPNGIATLALPGRWVPAGAIADTVVGMRDGDLVAETGAAPGRAVANIASAPLAERSRSPEVRVLARGEVARRRYERALDEWRVLTAAALVGLAGGALNIGVDYAKSRVQFGAPIGSYQAIQQRFADVVTAVDGARLVVRNAARAIRPESCAMAFISAAEAAQYSAGFALHVHGGYGFMLEYDIQLYFRRAKGWALVYGDTSRELQRLGDLLWARA